MHHLYLQLCGLVKSYFYMMAVPVADGQLHTVCSYQTLWHLPGQVHWVLRNRRGRSPCVRQGRAGGPGLHSSGELLPTLPVTQPYCSLAGMHCSAMAYGMADNLATTNTVRSSETSCLPCSLSGLCAHCWALPCGSL